MRLRITSMANTKAQLFPSNKLKRQAMTLTQLQYVVTIADTKSMNKAASELYVSQPALSATIRELEEDPLTIGYIVRKSHRLSTIGEMYIEELKKYKE